MRLPFGSERATAREPPGAAAGALPSTATNRSVTLPWSSEGRAALCAHMEARQPSRGVRHHISMLRALGGEHPRAGRAASCQHRRGPSLGPLGVMAACSMCIEPRAFMAGGATHRAHREPLKRRSLLQHHLEEQQPPGQDHLGHLHGLLCLLQSSLASSKTVELPKPRPRRWSADAQSHPGLGAASRTRPRRARQCLKSFLGRTISWQRRSTLRHRHRRGVASRAKRHLNGKKGESAGLPN